MLLAVCKHGCWHSHVHLKEVILQMNRFEGISWHSDETCIAYVAEEPAPSKPTFNDLGGYKKAGSSNNDCGTWKGQGEWEEDWGETYAGKRQPAPFVINVNSGEAQAVKGIDKFYIWFLLDGHLKRESLVLGTAITGRVHYMLLKHHTMSQKLMKLIFIKGE